MVKVRRFKYFFLVPPFFAPWKRQYSFRGKALNFELDFWSAFCVQGGGAAAGPSKRRQPEPFTLPKAAVCLGGGGAGSLRRSEGGGREAQRVQPAAGEGVTCDTNCALLTREGVLFGQRGPGGGFADALTCITRLRKILAYPSVLAKEESGDRDGTGVSLRLHFNLR